MGCNIAIPDYGVAISSGSILTGRRQDFCSRIFLKLSTYLLRHPDEVSDLTVWCGLTLIVER